MRDPIQARLRRRLAGFTAICLLAGGVPAVADPHHDGHDHGHHDDRDHRDGGWHREPDRWHRHWGYDGGYYAPPPVVYSRPYYPPPPVVYTPGFGLNIHIP